MTIASVILASGPVLYWKLDDPVFPTALDSSGNGNVGNYRGVVDLQQVGPETGTKGVLFGDAGGCFTSAPSPRRVTPLSMECWIAVQAIQATNNAIVYDGLSDSTGVGLIFGAGVASGQPAALLRGGIAIGGTSPLMSSGKWHHLVQTWSGAGTITNYLDGVAWVSSPGVPFNAIAATDPFLCGAANLVGQLLLMAHVALYATELSAATVAAHFASPVGLVQPGGSAGSGSLSIALDLLNKILAAVQRAY